MNCIHISEDEILKKNLKEMEELKKDLNKYPFNGASILTLGLLYLANGEFEKAGNEFLKILQVNPTDETAKEYIYLFGHCRESYEIVKENEFVLISKNENLQDDLITIRNVFRYIKGITGLASPLVTIFQGFKNNPAAYPFGRPLHKVIHLPISYSYEQLVHELAHIFIPHHFMIFNEGMAMYIENMLYPKPIDRIKTYDSQLLNSLLKENVFANILFYENPQESYLYAYHFVNSLIKRYGLKTVLDFYMLTQNIVHYNLMLQKFEGFFGESLGVILDNLEQVCMYHVEYY